MSEHASAVLREALALPADERARMAADLLASLDDGPEDPGAVAQAWGEELRRRAEDVLNGATGEEWETVRGRIAGTLRAE